MSEQHEDQSSVPEDGAPESEAVHANSDELDAPDAEAELDVGGDVFDSVLNIQDVETLQAELKEAQDRALRINAELENYRKRSQRSLEEERRYAGLPLMRDLLTVLDNLQRAISAARDNEGSAGLLEGVEMVADQLITILKHHQCEEIPAEGTKFDPNLHEAIAQFPSDDVEPGGVSQVTQIGYQLHGRVIRPAQVIVAAAKPDAE